jgi:hypothetical protein
MFLEHHVLLFGNINWPSYSEDLTAQLIFVEHVENHVYCTYPASFHLKVRIWDKIAPLSNEMLR